MAQRFRTVTFLIRSFDFGQKHCFNADMNCKLIDSVPKGEFEEINIDQQFANKTDDYKERYSLFIDRVLSLIEQRKPIKYTSAGLPTLDKIIEDALIKQNFEHQILKSDPDFHFLVPR
jgi:nicotinamidase-related amidase